MNWLVVAGLAKGEHQDHDDFYVRVKRENDKRDPDRWLPTSDDHRLLKQETMARLLTSWELSVQAQMLDALRAVHSGGSVRIEVEHPFPNKGLLAQLTLVVTPVRESGYEADEIELEIVPASGFAGSNLSWQLTIRALISISPPEQTWDRYKDSFANIGEPGAWTARLVELETLVENRELAESVPGRHSHYTHRQHLAGRTIDGRAVRALCGGYLVPTQDHEALPPCPTCQERFGALPR